jgi:cysteine desulfurase/selenocysteine lyase
MTLEELHKNEELRNAEFPVTREKIFLGHAGVCPLPARVHKAIARYGEDCTLTDQEFVLPEEWFLETRNLATRLLDAKREEIAFVGPTSLALSFIAEGLAFRKSDNVLVYQDDYPSNVYPWMTLAERGVEVRFLNIRDYGCIRTKDVIGQVDENTRLVALASCHFIAGFRIDLDELGSYLRERGILFCVDAIQTVGAFPTSMRYVDFAAADAHKWMLGPCAAGLMYVRKEVQEQLRPTSHGWHNLRCPNYVALDELNYKPDARRYEAGSHNMLGLVGLRAALELLQEIGIDNIGREALRKRSWIIPALQKKGYTVPGASFPPENSGAMISFYKEKCDLKALHEKLEKDKIITSLRSNRAGQQFIRISPHFYNTDAELQRVLELL